MSKIKYEQLYDGEWFSPYNKKYRHMCCDCALIHTVSFKLDENGKIWLRWNADRRATAAARRAFKFTAD